MSGNIETTHATLTENSTDRNEVITVSLADYIVVLVKQRKMIVRTMVAAFAISLVVSLALPNKYTSTVKILPPQQDQGLMGAMLAQLGGISGLASEMLSGGSLSDLYAGILKTTAIKSKIIDRFKLMEIYDVETRVEAYKKFDNTVNVSVGKKDGIISIEVEDKVPARAAEIANAMVEELEKVAIKMGTSGAGKNRQFLENRLKTARADLVNAEEAVRVFQSKHKVMDVSEQVKGTIEQVAALRGQLAVQEINLSGLRRQFTDSSQEVKQAQTAIANLRTQIGRLEGSGKISAIPSVGSIPQLGQEYLRVMREYKIQETLVDLLTKQYEVARLSEAKEITTIQVIQQGEVPDRKTKPKRSVIVLVSTVIAGFLATFIAYFLEYFDRMPSVEKQKWSEISGLIRKERTNC